MKPRPLSYRKVSKRLISLGSEIRRQRVSHVLFKHVDGRTTVVPNHPGEDIGKGLIRKIIRDVGIEIEEFYKEI